MKTLLRLLPLLLLATFASAEGLDPAVQAKLDAQFAIIESWAADPIVVEAVKTQNAKLPPELAALTQEKWRALTVLDPLVRGFSKNAAGQFLKSKRSPIISEAFLSDAAGCKVAFIAKTTNWCHKGNAKHDQPMAGQRWQGKIEVDESSGQQQIQLSVPVFDGGKPIGSLCIGISVTVIISS